MMELVSHQAPCIQLPTKALVAQEVQAVVPDLVTGPATSTSAAIDLGKKLSGVEALNVMDPGSIGLLRDTLRRTLDI